MVSYYCTDDGNLEEQVWENNAIGSRMASCGREEGRQAQCSRNCNCNSYNLERMLHSAPLSSHLPPHQRKTALWSDRNLPRGGGVSQPVMNLSEVLFPLRTKNPPTGSLSSLKKYSLYCLL